MKLHSMVFHRISNYESIMIDIAKLVKHAINKNINESYWADDYVDDYGNTVYSDEHLANFGIPDIKDVTQVGKYSKERIIVDITELVRDNYSDYADILDDLYAAICDECKNVQMTTPVIEGSKIDYVSFLCNKRDMAHVKHIIKQHGYKIVSTQESYKLGIRK